jgi:hypothetical protein
MSGDSILTYLTSAKIRDDQRTLEGEVLTRPALLATDGASLTWACDVKISGYDDPLRNVPIAVNNRDLIYADTGQAVTLSRNPGGAWEIIGLAKRKPGQRVRVPVAIGWDDGAGGDLGGNLTITTGTPIDMTLSARALTLAELMTLGGGFGVAPLGVTGIFRAGVLIELGG